MKETDNDKPKRGGKREGAGRPKTDSTLVSLRIQNDLLEALKIKSVNKTEYINRALRKMIEEDNNS